MSLPSAVDVLVIGAGAAGLMTAITAAQRGRKVLVVDHANKVGKKILMSGGGRCNFTNLYTEPANYLSDNEHFCKSALSRYTQWDFIALVDKHQVPYHEKTLGQLFCDNKSQDILALLLDECQAAGVEVRAKCSIESLVDLSGECDDPSAIGASVSKLVDDSAAPDSNNKNKLSQKKTGQKKLSRNTAYQLETSLGTVKCESLVVASGGLSIPTMGATGFGYDLAKQFGLKLNPTRAGLVPFTLQPHDKEALLPLVGNSVKVRVGCNGQSFLESMLFTHRGLSGPAILQISSYWLPGDSIEIDLYPDGDLEDLLFDLKKQRPNMELKTALSELYTKAMGQFFCEHWFNNKALKQFNEPELGGVAKALHGWVVKPSGTEGYRTAEVTLGGVSTEGVSSKTMEAKEQPGLYFVGEVLDVTGHLGGFNFQWAWASGFAAGSFV